MTAEKTEQELFVATKTSEKITLDLPKGSHLEVDVRRYVASAIGARGLEIMRLKDVKITAEYEVAEARP